MHRKRHGNDDIVINKFARNKTVSLVLDFSKCMMFCMNNYVSQIYSLYKLLVYVVIKKIRARIEFRLLILPGELFLTM